MTDELVAILKRFQRRTASSQAQRDTWLIDKSRWRFIWPKHQFFAPLTRSEMALISCFVKKSDIHVSKEDIAKALGHNSLAYDYRRLAVMVRRLRNKTKDISGNEIPLHTAYGTGYAFKGQIEFLEVDQPLA